MFELLMKKTTFFSPTKAPQAEAPPSRVGAALRHDGAVVAVLPPGLPAPQHPLGHRPRHGDGDPLPQHLGLGTTPEQAPILPLSIPLGQSSIKYDYFFKRPRILAVIV